MGAAANSGWQNTYRQQNWRLFRHNTEGTIQQWPGGVVKYHHATELVADCGILGNSQVPP